MVHFQIMAAVGLHVVHGFIARPDLIQGEEHIRQDKGPEVHQLLHHSRANKTPLLYPDRSISATRGAKARTRPRERAINHKNNMTPVPSTPNSQPVPSCISPGGRPLSSARTRNYTAHAICPNPPPAIYPPFQNKHRRGCITDALRTHCAGYLREARDRGSRGGPPRT